MFYKKEVIFHMIDRCTRWHAATILRPDIDGKKKAWVHWEERLNPSWRVPANEPFYKILVPTVDTTRYTYLLGEMIKAERHVLLTGDVGVGKTSIVFSTLAALGESFVFSNLNFSAQTSSTRVSDGFEARVEKRTKDTFAPPGGKKLVMFIDDFNMPEKEIFGAQPPLEILRQWMQYEFWYDLKKQTQRFIKDTKVVAAPNGEVETFNHFGEDIASPDSVFFEMNDEEGVVLVEPVDGGPRK